MAHIKFNHHYQLFILTASVSAIVLVAVNSLLTHDPRTKQLFEWFDDFICLAFFIDFLITLHASRNRKKYFLTWGWIDLLSSIPNVNALRIGRLGRVFQILRALRILRATKILGEVILEKRAESAFLAVSLLALLVVVTSSILILQFETDPLSNIKSAEDALWWAITTVTTVGYGDKYPVTTEGRIVAGVLMVTGVALLGVTTGFLASWFLKSNESKQETENQLIRKEIQELKQLLVEISLKHEDSDIASPSRRSVTLKREVENL